ncbi:RimJ/RimL family protein N-acetyltransferase [Acetoanaerobium pronyense]|uniref:RimJ/RimL family protein N-acetyltransferase n=1 Tax=Acetoanaerobium pronyense TaxID=1482736 RepID=A0ABS4KLE8_9FIRM|nr:GNAT family protein [Acetoanaerobium pronyense]MBP2028599.1 RimJ/RimL family protein N-acetyltransferase [Acetoanaerobium pronyense]
MHYTIKEMSKNHSVDISTWTYKEPYNIYNGNRNEEFIEELLNGSYFSVIDEKYKIVGFYCFGNAAQVPIGKQYQAYDDINFLDIGLGMRPDLCGSGEGYDFFLEGIRFAENKFLSKKFRLTVASFNKRAIRLYERIGFKKTVTFERKNLDDSMIFLVMEMILKDYF